MSGDALRGMLVSVRPLADDDVAQFPEWFSFTRAGVLVGGGAVDRMSTQDWARMLEGSKQRYAIVEKLDGEAVGALQWWPLNAPGSFEVAGAVGDEGLWGDGYGLEGALLLVDYLFTCEAATRIEMVAAAYNHRSIGFLVKGGIVIDAVMRDCLYIDGAYYDAVRCSLPREQYYGSDEGFVSLVRLLRDEERREARRLVESSLLRARPSTVGS